MEHEYCLIKNLNDEKFSSFMSKLCATCPLSKQLNSCSGQHKCTEKKQTVFPARKTRAKQAGKLTQLCKCSTAGSSKARHGTQPKWGSPGLVSYLAKSSLQTSICFARASQQGSSPLELHSVHADKCTINAHYQTCCLLNTCYFSGTNCTSSLEVGGKTQRAIFMLFSTQQTTWQGVHFF